MLGAGLYAPQLRHWLRLFPANRFLVLEESELREHPADVAERLTRLGLQLFNTANILKAGRQVQVLVQAMRDGVIDLVVHPDGSDEK